MSDILTRAREALARAEAATPGPWRPGDVNEVVLAGSIADLAFVAHARDDVPALAREVLRQAAEVTEVRRIATEALSNAIRKMAELEREAVAQGVRR